MSQHLFFRNAHHASYLNTRTCSDLNIYLFKWPRLVGKATRRAISIFFLFGPRRVRCFGVFPASLLSTSSCCRAVHSELFPSTYQSSNLLLPLQTWGSHPFLTTLDNAPGLWFVVELLVDPATWVLDIVKCSGMNCRICLVLGDEACDVACLNWSTYLSVWLSQRLGDCGNSNIQAFVMWSWKIRQVSNKERKCSCKLMITMETPNVIQK